MIDGTGLHDPRAVFPRECQPFLDERVGEALSARRPAQEETGDHPDGGIGGIAYARAPERTGERHVVAAESDFGADRIWKFDVNLPESAKPVADRLATALAPLGITRGRDIAGDGTDVQPMMKQGVAAIDLAQDGTRYFDLHHTPDDTLDKIDPVQLRQNVAAWTTVLAILSGGIEEPKASKRR